MENNALYQKPKITFRCPVHQSPCAIAHTFTYNPYISLKIDGIYFEELIQDNHEKYWPNFPPTWTKIEGEFYEREVGSPIYYVFYIETCDKIFNSLKEMYEEIQKYFFSKVSADITFDYTTFPEIKKDMINDIQQSYLWCDQVIGKEDKFIWWPKKYWALNTHSWNEYIDELDDLNKFVHSKEITNLIKHDGLVISPNQPSAKKSLVKLKPQNELTIDLYFSGRDFFSRERTSYKQLIGQNTINCVANSVYRLAPDGKGRFIAVYKRETGKKPNPDNIILDILHKYKNYFSIKQLKDQYINPWYGELNLDGLNEMTPLFNYVQNIYNTILPHMSTGVVFDIGCGSMGQYSRHFLNQQLTQYIGLDIDLAKLHEAQVKVKYNQKFAFMLMDISKKWNKQNDYFPNDLWNTYYYNLVRLNQTANNIISIFSSQYANISKESWNTYVNEINFRAKKGTRLFFMWVDSSKIDSSVQSDYYSFNENTNQLTVNLPHRSTHVEAGLGNEIMDSFYNDWSIDTSLMDLINETYDEKCKISSYIKLINYVVMIKK